MFLASPSEYVVVMFSISTDPYNEDMMPKDVPPILEDLEEEDRENIIDE